MPGPGAESVVARKMEVFLKEESAGRFGGRYTEKAGITWQLDDALVEEKMEKVLMFYLDWKRANIIGG